MKLKRNLSRIHCKETCVLFQRASSAPAGIELSCSEQRPQDVPKRRPDLNVVTWNIAAPNNNPFEYWSMHDCKEYDELMFAVESCLDNPQQFDIPLGEIFTLSMYQELRVELKEQGMTDLDSLDNIWRSDLSIRNAISGFLKDPTLGEKRLISMPDRMTNTVKARCGRTLHRPSPISGCLDDMGDVQTWWAQWRQFMFRTAICVRGKSLSNVFSVLETISRAKYPTLTEAEESISISLQTLCLAVFDAVYTHLLSELAPESWQPLKRSLHKAFFENKASSCVSILQSQYRDADIIFVQEASEAFAARAGVFLNHHVLRAKGVDGRRSQMSLILVRKGVFSESSALDVTEKVCLRMPSKCVEEGDLCVFKIQSHKGPLLLASFHGDSNGRSTGPTLAAVCSMARDEYAGHMLVFGLDANVPSDPAGLDGPEGHWEMEGLLAGSGLSSCWKGLDWRDLWTTFNARTHLQPQLHKAVGLRQVMDRRHRRLKDWILFYDAQLALQGTPSRDNTGHGGFEARVMPSQGFPSDHAVVSATLRVRRFGSVHAATRPVLLGRRGLRMSEESLD